MPLEQDPVDYVGIVMEITVQTLIHAVETKVPAEYRAAVLRHLADRITLALMVRAAIEDVRR